MPYALNFYKDQVGADGATTEALPAAHRLVYVRYGSVLVNGRVMTRDQGAYLADAIALRSNGEWSEVWRWDLVSPSVAPLLHKGAAVFSSLRMSQIVSAIEMEAGSQWLFRLDQIVSDPGRVSNPHRPWPGIRCLVEGAFNIHQSTETVREILPGDPWWERGSEAVIAWSPAQIGAVAIRAMIGPPAMQGQPTGKWLTLSTPHTKGNWKLYADQVVTV